MDKATTIKLLKEGFEGIEKFASECVDILENSEESQIDWSQLEWLADDIFQDSYLLWKHTEKMKKEENKR